MVSDDEIRAFGGDPAALRTEQQWIAEAGRVLYGERWMRRFAADAGVDVAYVSRLVSGKARLTSEKRVEIVAFLQRSLKQRLQDNVYAEGVLRAAQRVLTKPGDT